MTATTSDAEALRLVFRSVRRWVEGGPGDPDLAVAIEDLTRAMAAGLTATHGPEVGREFLALMDACAWVRVAQASTFPIGES